MPKKARGVCASMSISVNMKARAMLVAVAGLLLAASGPFSPRAFGTTYDRYWDGGGVDPNWSDKNNWTADVEPTSAGDWATIGSSTGGGITPATAVISTTGEACGPLCLGYNAGDSGTIQMVDGSLSVVGSATVGNYGTGTFTQTGGTHTVGSSLYLSAHAGSKGDYTLSDGILNVGQTTYVGYNGTGTFTQTGGTHTVSALSIGGGNIYHLQGGSLVVSGSGSVAGTGLLDWSGGSLQVGGTISKLALGYESGADVSYSGPLIQSVSELYVGYYGRATLTQTGGTQSLSQLYLGYVSGSEGNYILSDGSLIVASITRVGYNGASAFTQTGGTHTTGSLSVGANGHYVLEGGICSVGPLTLDGGFSLAAGRLAASSTEQVNAGVTFLQTGGEHTIASTLTVNAGGQYILEGGTLTAAKIVLYSGAILRTTGGTLNATAFEQRNATIEGTLENRGTFSYYGGSFAGRLVNLGQTVFTVDFTAADGCENYSTLDVALGRTLTFNGPGMANFATMTLSGGEVRGPQLLNEFGGKLSGKGTIGTDLANNGSLDLGGLLRVTGAFSNLGTVSVSVTEALDISGLLANGGSITLASGTVTGSGTIRNDPGGTIQGSGGVNVPVENNGGLIRATQATALVISALAVGNANGGELAVATSATLRIDAGFVNAGMVTLEGSGAVLTGGRIQNEGTIAGGGRITNPITNEGILRADHGTLTLAGAGISNPAVGTIEVMSGSTLLVSQGLSANAGIVVMRGGTLESAAGATENSGTIMGYGTFRTRGLTNIGGVMVGSGNMDVVGPVVNVGAFGVEGGRVATFYGDVSGAGSFPGPGSYVFLGSVSPGNSPGMMDFGGSVTFTGAARLCIELADNDNSDPLSPSYDSMKVAGNVSLGGKLQLTWVPVPGDQGSKFGGVYNLVVYKGQRTGQFGEIISALGAYIDGDVRYDVDLGDGWKAVQITLHDLLDGDADLNGVVGYGDLLGLMKGFSGSDKGWSSGDFNLDGHVDAWDYILLKTSFGRSVPIHGGVFAPSSVPEPATLSLLALGGLAVIRRRRK